MSFLGLETLYTSFLKPQRYIPADVVGNAISGGRNSYGYGNAIDLSGGGFVTIGYANCYVQSPEEHGYINHLAALLNGSFRNIYVPILTDWQGPFPTFDRFPAPYASHIPHSDGTLFSDGSGYSQATVWGKVMEDVDIGGVIRIRVYNPSRPLGGVYSDWFSIYHPVEMGWRAYRYWKVLTRYADGNEVINGTSYPYQEYSLAIGPALREAVTAGTRVEFARPRFTAMLAPGTRILSDVEGFYSMRPTLQFVESFKS